MNGASLSDILTILITVVGIAVAVAAVVGSFLIGQKYSDHVEELAYISGLHRQLNVEFEKLKIGHTAAMTQLRLGFECNTRISQATEMITQLQTDLSPLVTSGQWRGKTLPVARKKEQIKRVEAQIEKHKLKAVARRTEIDCLINEYPVRLNSVRYLADRHGDGESVTFLSKFILTIVDIDERYEYVKLLGLLQARLGSALNGSAITAR